MRLLVVMDAPETLNPATDTTVTFIAEARRRGHAVEVCRPESLALDVGGDPIATVQPVIAESLTSRPAVSVGEPLKRRLGECDVVLMRKDPPFDVDYYFATMLLERGRGLCRIINDPRGLRDANEKLYIFHFPSLIAPTIVTRDIADIDSFLDAQGGDIIVKPLDGSGGSGVFQCRRDDRNLRVILETSTCNGRRWVMAQRYLPESRAGDKRILLLDGEPIGAVLRVPRHDDTRGNLHVGGRAERTTLTARDREICAAVGARCHEDGLYFVGIDVIGDWLTEVNVTSPTGVQEIDRLEGSNLAARVVDWLEK